MSTNRRIEIRLSNFLIGVALLFYIPLAATYVFCEGEVASLKDFQYWDNGKVRACTMYDTEGRLKAKAYCRHSDGSTEKIERYDVYGNKTEEAFYDEKGRLKNGIDGWAAMRWWYEGSHLVSQISYDEMGRPLERRQYSESGTLVLRQYLDRDNLNPYEEANMHMLLGPNNMRYYDPKEQIENDMGLFKK